MKWSIEGKWFAGGFGLVMIVIGYISIISYQNATRLVGTAEKVKENHEVLETLIGVLADLNNADSGKHGYILSGYESELKRYHQATDQINPRLERLKVLFVDNHNQKQRLLTLKSLLNRKKSISQQSLELYKKDASAKKIQTKLSIESINHHSKIEKIIKQMQTQEESMLEALVSASQSNIQSRMLIEITGTLLTFIILIGVYIQLYRQMVKRQQAEAKQLQLAQEKEMGELKLQFFSMASHEFRTPLSIILGSAQLLEESLQPIVEKKKLKNLDRIQSHARLLTQLLSDILTIARAEAGKLEYQPKLLEMQSFCLNLIEDMQSLSQFSNSIKFAIEGNEANAWVDDKLLYSILSNLISNAIKYSPPDSKIDFSVICKSEFLIFKIKDKGIGISQETQQQMYEPFRRGENAKDVIGTGLGLAVVKKCLELHNGQISVESEHGSGTTFTVIIPQN